MRACECDDCGCFSGSGEIDGGGIGDDKASDDCFSGSGESGGGGGGAEG